MASKLNYFSDFYEEEILNGIVPELYIDKKLLTKEDTCLKKNDKVYKINDELFYEDDRNANDLQEFSLELNNNEDYEDLIVEIKENAFVVMVNSIILLSCHQWNTITSEYPTKCLVCDLIVQDPSGHIKTEDHIVNLDKHKPLKKFNLHITRLIGDKYHCAVCNEVYERNDNTHLDSESHMERMLYATNTATDVIYDFDNNENKSVNNDNDDNETSVTESGFDSDGFYDLNDFTNNKSTLRSYAAVVKHSTPATFIDHVIGNKTFTIDSDTYHMILRPNSREFYCMLCIQFHDVNNISVHCKSEEHLRKLKQCKIIDKHEEHFIRKVTPKFYHCGTCNNLQLSGGVEAHLETHAKKQKIKTDDSNDKQSDQENRTKENNDTEIKGENKTNENNDKVHQNNENRAQIAQSNVYPTGHLINKINPLINYDIVLNRFNCNIRVSFMSYNLILNRGYDFICIVCNFASRDMTLHLNDARHILCLENFPYQPFFGINLVRMIQRYAHCTICNVLVDVAVIHLHTTCQPHLFLLNKALNPININLVMNQTNIDSNQPVNTERPTDVNITIPSKSLQEIPRNNSETSNQATVIETAVNQTEVDSDNLEYDIQDNVNVLKEYVYLKIKKSLVKISSASYHTLVHTGDGNRHCFICSYKITKSLRRHIESKAHMDRMNHCNYIRNYEKDLLRQINLIYHCGVCNVLLQKCDLEKHLIWPLHKNNEIIEKRFRKRDFGLYNIINVEFQSENTCFNEQEEQLELVFNIKSGETSSSIGGIVIKIPPNYKNGGKMLSISWEAWQGVTRLQNGVYCNLCHDCFYDIDVHLEEDRHRDALSKPIEKQYLPACIRKITELILNCVTCNLVFPNKKRNISEHMAGKKHVSNYGLMSQSAFTDITTTLK